MLGEARVRSINICYCSGSQPVVRGDLPGGLRERLGIFWFFTCESP